MASIKVEAISSGHRVALNKISVELLGPHWDRGVIRGSLNVRNGTKILFRDTVNLTSERARLKLVKRMEEKKIEVEERVLIALEEAARQPKKTKKKLPTETLVKGPPLKLVGLQRIFSKWLLIEDPDYLLVLVGAVLAHSLGGDPVWILFVAPPGATKSEVLRTLYGYLAVFPLSDLTPKTFASGLDTTGRDPSLLARLENEILVMKDFTTILEMQRDARREVLAQLREIYDGRFDKTWGTGKELHWEGRVALLAGVTEAIDKHLGAMAILGERFLLFRIKTPDRKEMAQKALRGSGDEKTMRQELRAAMHRFLLARENEPPTVSDEVIDVLSSVADLITRARSPVIRDGYRRRLEYAPEPEAPTRFSKALRSLASGVALARDSREVTKQDLRIVLRVALDCLPGVRWHVVKALVKTAITEDLAVGLSNRRLTGSVQFSNTAVRRELENLEALSVVSRTRSQGKDSWELKPEWKDTMRTILGEA